MSSPQPLFESKRDPHPLMEAQTSVQPQSPFSSEASPPPMTDNSFAQSPDLSPRELSQTPPPSQSQHPPATQDTTPYAEILASHGIKVRDFAYESTLPPVTAYRKRQIQPGRHILKRGREENRGEPSSHATAERQHGVTSKRPRLQREATETLEPPSSAPMRERGFADINNYEESLSQFPASQQSTWAVQGSSQPPHDLQPEEYIDTPTVTPNGSLQWKEADRKPLEYHIDPVTPRPDLRLLPRSSLLRWDAKLESVFIASSPLTEPPSSQPRLSRSSSSSIRRTPSAQLIPQVPESPVAVLCSRYHLRTRARVPMREPMPVPPLTKIGSKPQPRSARAAHKLSHTPSFQGVVTRSRQSAHARRSSKAARTLKSQNARKAAQNVTAPSGASSSRR